MNETQRKSLAKYAYDVSKIILTVTSIGQFVPERKLDIAVFISGTFAAVIFLFIGLWIEKEVQK